MMSAVGGGGGTLVADNSADQLCECDSDMGGGVKKSENVADVIYK